MAERKRTAARARTNLAKLRLDLGVTQQELADAAGIGIRALQELERGNIDEPQIGYMQNFATALGVTLVEVCEPAWIAPFKYETPEQKKTTGPPRRTTEPVEKIKPRPGRFQRGG